MRKWIRRFHAASVVVWSVALPFAILTDIRSSVPFLVGISVYNLILGHAAGWAGGDAARAADGE